MIPEPMTVEDWDLTFSYDGPTHGQIVEDMFGVLVTLAYFTDDDADGVHVRINRDGQLRYMPNRETACAWVRGYHDNR